MGHKFANCICAILKVCNAVCKLHRLTDRAEHSSHCIACSVG